MGIERELYYGAFTESWTPLGAWLELEWSLKQTRVALGWALVFSWQSLWLLTLSHKPTSQAWGGWWKQVRRAYRWDFGILSFISWDVTLAWPGTHCLGIVGIFSKPFLLFSAKCNVPRNFRSTPLEDSKLCNWGFLMPFLCHLGNWCVWCGSRTWSCVPCHLELPERLFCFWDMFSCNPCCPNLKLRISLYGSSCLSLHVRVIDMCQHTQMTNISPMKSLYSKRSSKEDESVLSRIRRP